MCSLAVSIYVRGLGASLMMLRPMLERANLGGTHTTIKFAMVEVEVETPLSAPTS